MPLPWKKNSKVTRISQLVADLQSPSKRGGSLVVETGFPTSLVDLFVKNRDRLRKPSPKKHKKKSRHEIDSSDVSPSSSPSPPPEAPPMTPRLQLPPPPQPTSCSTEGGVVLRRPNRGEFGGVEALEVVGGKYCDNRENNEVIKRSADGDESYGNSVFVMVLKTFVVVALALSTKKLVVGITMSAFVLLLLEYAGKHVDGDVFLKPCTEAGEALLASIERGLSFFRPRKASRRLEKCMASKSLALTERTLLWDDSVDEIEKLGPNFEEETAIREESNSGWIIGEKGFGCLDTSMVVAVKEGCEDRGEEAALLCKHHSRSHRIKSKIIKKFVPKKLRGLNKKGKKSEGRELGEGEEEGSENSSNLSSIDEQENGGEPEMEGENKLKQVKELRLREHEDHDDDDSDDRIVSSCELSRVSSETEGIGEKGGREGEGNLGCLMLILIVLVGLVGGRIWALVLTVVWCLVLNFVRYPSAYQNVPMIRSLVSI